MEEKKIFTGKLNNGLDYRIEEIMNGIYILETKLETAKNIEWQGHGAFSTLEYAMEYLNKLTE